MKYKKIISHIKSVSVLRRMIVLIPLLMVCSMAFASVGVRSIKTNGASYNDEASPTSSFSPSVSRTPQVTAGSISLSKESLTMNIGDKAALSAVISPDNATDKSLQWASSAAGVVSTDQNGQLTALQQGTADICATASNGITAECKVTVNSAKPVAASTIKPPPKTPAMSPAAPEKTFHGAVFDNSSQVIVVTATGMNTIYAALNTYQKTNGTWNKVMSVNARVGKYGLVYDNQRVEGDLRTPAGVYSLPYAFGTAPNPGTRLPYKPIDSNTYYDGQCGSPTFNNFVEVQPANNEFEYMDIGPYQYGLDIDFNPEGVVGKGSAIFLHCSTASGYTAGCVSISPGNIVKVLQWLDPAQNPKILISPVSDLSEYYY
jgi:L,D-peptidoglycan transpeptidase YkuD (ErfK/YbiS/YcfS/YnhG family)